MRRGERGQEVARRPQQESRGRQGERGEQQQKLTDLESAATMRKNGRLAWPARARRMRTTMLCPGGETQRNSAPNLLDGARTKSRKAWEALVCGAGLDSKRPPYLSLRLPFPKPFRCTASPSFVVSHPSTWLLSHPVPSRRPIAAELSCFRLDLSRRTPGGHLPLVNSFPPRSPLPASSTPSRPPLQPAR